ncbi:hypothetical protein D9M69_701280 [compost metagenome]
MALFVAQDVGDLVLEDGEHPGLQAGLAGKRGRVLEGAEQGFLHGVFGQLGVAQLQRRELEHLAPQGAEFSRIDPRRQARRAHDADRFVSWLRAAL